MAAAAPALSCSAGSPVPTLTAGSPVPALTAGTAAGAGWVSADGGCCLWVTREAVHRRLTLAQSSPHSQRPGEGPSSAGRPPDDSVVIPPSDCRFAWG